MFLTGFQNLGNNTPFAVHYQKKKGENAFLFLQKLKGLNLKGMITVVINHSTYFNFCF